MAYALATPAADDRPQCFLAVRLPYNLKRLSPGEEIKGGVKWCAGLSRLRNGSRRSAKSIEEPHCRWEPR
jgi:hypothetical protein